MSIRAQRTKNDAGEPVIVITLTGEQSVENFKITIERALNCKWEEAPQEIKELSDLFVHGQVMTMGSTSRKRVDSWK